MSREKYPILCRVPFIYGLVDPLEPEHVRYAGLASSNPKRPYLHMDAKVGTHKGNWVQSLIADGRMYRIIILCELPLGSSEEEQFKAEKAEIASLKIDGHQLTNGTDGGDGLLNPSPAVRQKLRVGRAKQIIRHSKATRQKMSDSWTDERRESNPLKGRSRPQAVCQQIRESHMGIVPNDATREKLREWAKIAYKTRVRDSSGRFAPNKKEEVV